MSLIKIGCDPEFFLADLKGQLKSSIGKIGGTKAYPMALPLGPGYAVQEDNVSVEFNTPPAETREAFIQSVSGTLKFLSDHVHEAYGWMVVNTSAESFPEEELQDPRALEFGCEPDYNAWSGRVNPRPSAPDKTLRSCGGHVHVGFDIANKGEDHARSIIQHMDLYLGVPSVLMDKGEKRKELYGQAGACRIKNYGVEYRTLSNFWIFDEKKIGWVYDNALKAVASADAQNVLQEQDRQLVQDCINNNDKAVADYLADKYQLEVLHV